jgi:hypothetical protein
VELLAFFNHLTENHYRMNFEFLKTGLIKNWLHSNKIRAILKFCIVKMNHVNELYGAVSSIAHMSGY